MINHLNTKFNYRWLLFSILGLFAVLPFQAYEGELSEILIKVFVTSIMFSSIHCCWGHKIATTVLGILMLPTLASTWFDNLLLPDNSYILSNFFFYVVFIYFISTNILKERDHTSNALAGALSAYLLIGLGFCLPLHLYGHPISGSL